MLRSQDNPPDTCLSLLPSCLVRRRHISTHFITTTTWDIYGLGRYYTSSLKLLVCLYQSTTQEKRPLHLSPSNPRIDVHSTPITTTRLSLSPKHPKKTLKTLAALSMDETSNPVLQPYARFSCLICPAGLYC